MDSRNPSPLPPGSLNLGRAPRTLFFFGLSGSGKSYVGDVVGTYAGWDVYHADEDITPAMRSALARAEPFTDAMRAEYFSALIGKILERREAGHLERREAGHRLVVTQGAYKRRHREYLLTHVPDMELVWVTAPDALIAERIAHRKGGIAFESAAALRADFEVPAATTKIVRNDAGDQHIIGQLNRLFAPAASSG